MVGRATLSRVEGVVDPARLGGTTLPGGRRLGWAEWGPQDGTPVVLCPGAATSRHLGFAADALDALHVRLVSVDRPGLGASDPAPARTLSDWGAAVSDLARVRGLGGLGVVGFSQGAPFALAVAASGVATAVAVVAGTDELAHPSLDGLVDPGVRQLVQLAVADPGRAEATFARMDAETMWDMVMAMSGEADRAAYAEPSFARAYRVAVEEAFAQGSGGYARDTVLAMSPWPFDVTSIAVPVDLWYGALDASPVHSPDLGATLARRIPGARRHVLDDAGGALLWTHGEQVLRELLRRMARG
jgi:pimeloyl-ACP methyl ester carboxylesterase